MLTAAFGRPVYMACGATDMRKSIDALAALVQLTFQLDPCTAVGYRPLPDEGCRKRLGIRLEAVAH